MNAVTFAVLLLVAVTTWQVDMAVECAGRCVRRPKVVRVEKSPPPQCRGPQCQTPKPPPVQPSSSR
jgi:hypothetical protein